MAILRLFSFYTFHLLLQKILLSYFHLEFSICQARDTCNPAQSDIMSMCKYMVTRQINNNVIKCVTLRFVNCFSSRLSKRKLNAYDRFSKDTTNVLLTSNTGVHNLIYISVIQILVLYFASFFLLSDILKHYPNYTRSSCSLLCAFQFFL